MRRGRFTEDQIIGVLREHEAGVKTAELCRKHGISDASRQNTNSRSSGCFSPSSANAARAAWTRSMSVILPATRHAKALGWIVRRASPEHERLGKLDPGDADPLRRRVKPLTLSIAPSAVINMSVLIV